MTSTEHELRLALNQALCTIACLKALMEARGDEFSKTVVATNAMVAEYEKLTPGTLGEVGKALEEWRKAKRAWDRDDGVGEKATVLAGEALYYASSAIVLAVFGDEAR